MKVCPRCGFYNTDERDRCLKCKAILEHDWTAAPRKVRLRRFPIHRLWAAAADMGYSVRRLFVFPLPEDCPYRYPWTAGFLSLLPGLGQIYNRQYRKASWFLLVSAALIGLVLATVLHPINYVFLALLVGWVLLSFNDALVTATRIDGQQWTRGHALASYSALLFYLGLFWSLSQFFLIGLLIGIILYCLHSMAWPTGQGSRASIAISLVVAMGLFGGACLLSRSGNPVLHRWVYWPQDILEPTIRRGDFLYVDCVTYWFRRPRLGELVYYDPPGYSLRQGDNTFAVNPKNAIERVVALPGDRFRREGKRYFRNDQVVPPAFQPLHPEGLPERLEFEVPAGRYLVLISYAVEEGVAVGLGGTRRSPLPRDGATEEWHQACLVTRKEILGRCLFIWHPVRRRQWLTPTHF